MSYLGLMSQTFETSDSPFWCLETEHNKRMSSVNMRGTLGQTGQIKFIIEPLLPKQAFPIHQHSFKTEGQIYRQCSYFLRTLEVDIYLYMRETLRALLRVMEGNASLTKLFLGSLKLCGITKAV